MRVLSSSPFQEGADPASGPSDREVDVVVIGAGIGGLSCGSLTAKYGLQTLVLEAHDTPGGCAHSFQRYSSSAGPSSSPPARTRAPFRFDSGPSLVSGLSSRGTNPLRQVLDAIGAADDVAWKTYDGWVVHDTSDGASFKVTTGGGADFEEAIERKAGPEARREFAAFRDRVLERGGLSEASARVPPFALRGDAGAVASLASYLLRLLSIGTKGALLTGPFAAVMDLHGVRHPFVRKWFDYLAFALSGLDAAHTQAAPVAYMMSDLHREGAVLDYPMGGMGSLVQALVAGMERHGGELELNSRVERLLLRENERGAAECTGVVLASGQVIRARRAVVCNAPLWNMARMLEDSAETTPRPAVQRAIKSIRKEADDMAMTGSFMHLHLGIPKEGLPDDLECHHSVLNMTNDVAAEQNMVIISIPTVFDPSLAQEGYHLVHAYTAACDNFDPWTKFLDAGSDGGKVGHGPNTRAAASYAKSDGYRDLKDERAQVLWRAVERVIPDVRERARRRGSVVLVGTPLTHRRYNQRYRGTYGPAPPPGKDVWELAGATTPVKKLLRCGDTCFPGIGLPGVAASGTIAANTVVSVAKQTSLMDELKRKGALQ